MVEHSTPLSRTFLSQGVALLAEFNAAERGRTSLWTTFGYTLILIAVILAGAAVVAWLDRWRKRPTAARLSASDELAQYRVLYERGELSAEEFARLRALLGSRLKHELALPAAPGLDVANPAAPGLPRPSIESNGTAAPQPPREEPEKS